MIIAVALESTILIYSDKSEGVKRVENETSKCGQVLLSPGKDRCLIFEVGHLPQPMNP